jgi:hypothetical protein
MCIGEKLSKGLTVYDLNFYTLSYNFAVNEGI